MGRELVLGAIAAVAAIALGLSTKSKDAGGPPGRPQPGGDASPESGSEERIQPSRRARFDDTAVNQVPPYGM